jgi:signal transduction histidine kinase
VRLLRCRVYPVENAGSSGRKVVGICVEELKSAARIRESSQHLPSGTGSAAAELNGPSAVAAVKEDKPSGDTGAQFHAAGTDPDQSGFSRRVYDKLARQIHYSLVPLSTHAQLLDHGHYDEDFRDSLREVLGTGIHRFQRFSRQLSYMVRQQYDLSERVDWKKLVEGAFEEAADNYEDPRALFELLDESTPALIRCEEVAVKFALAEVFLNALQANSGNPQFLVKVKRRMSPNDPKGIEIIVRDMGSGFEPRALEKAFEPFFSTRPAGLGLGLTVAKKIIEGHFGSIRIRPTPAKNQHEVAILLPVT